MKPKRDNYIKPINVKPINDERKERRDVRADIIEDIKTKLNNDKNYRWPTTGRRFDEDYKLGFRLTHHVSAYRDFVNNPKGRFDGKRRGYRRCLFIVLLDALRNANSSSILERWFSESMRSLANRRHQLSPKMLAAEGFLRTAMKNFKNLYELAEDIKSVTRTTLDDDLRERLEQAKGVFEPYVHESSDDEDEIGQGQAEYFEVRTFFRDILKNNLITLDRRG